MPNIEIRIQTVVLVALLLLLALAAPFLTGLIPQGRPLPVLAAEETPREVILTLDDASPTVQPPASNDTLSQTDSTYVRAVQVQIKSLLAAQQAAAQPVIERGVEVQVQTGTGANLNVRAAPGLETAVLGGALQGERLPALARSADDLWLQVRWNGTVGWVYGPLTVPVNGDTTALPVVQ